MVLVVIVLAVVAVAGIVMTYAMGGRLKAQRQLTAAADQRSTQQAVELATVSAALEEAGHERTVAEERAVAAEEATTLTAEQAELVALRAAAAETAREQAQRDAEAATDAQRAAEERAAAAERRASELAAARTAAGGGIDAEVMWTLERARSERTWRMAVAPGPDADSVFANAADPLVEALQVELDAAREEVGAVVELEADLPDALTAAGSVLTLRAAQELLAGVVRQAEETTLVVRADGADVIVSVRSIDEHGEPVAPAPLLLPPSLDIDATDDGIRIRDAIRDSSES